MACMTTMLPSYSSFWSFFLYKKKDRASNKFLIPFL